LADEFKDQLDLEYFKVDNQSPTLSVGIAVAHHLEPLSDALRLVRAAEKMAKSVEGKNALAVTLSKRSGSDRTVQGRWGTLDQRLNYFILLHRTEKIPDGAAYELRDLALKLKTDKGNDKHQILQTAMRFEAMRILQRKRAKQGEDEIDNAVLNDFESYISPRNDIADLANELIIARLFADATELAGIAVNDLAQKRLKEEARVNADLDH
jgi:CRISPR-associated protein Cmr2